MSTDISQVPANAVRRTNKQRNRNPKKKGGMPLAVSEDSAPPAEKDSKANSTTLTEVDEEANDVCWICAEAVKFYSLSECNHRTCHVCALRLRALYKKLECTFCKHPQAIVIFTSSSSTHFADYNQSEIPYKDDKLSIVFETQEMMEETLILLRFNCPDPECAFIAKGWNDLKVHVRAIHSRAMCDLCIRFKKVFAHEHTLYLAEQLRLHLPSSAHRPGKIIANDKIEGGIHPLCEFCKECFFGDDELFAHMRERHEDCFVCKRQGIRDQYFHDYNSLERHFTEVHHPCTQPDCLARKFVVFGSILDLKAHVMEEHGANMSAKDMKGTRRIETNFEFEEPRGSGGRRRDRDRDRGHEREREPPPHSHPPPQTSRSQVLLPALERRREGFGAALTSEDVPGSGSSTPVNRPNGGRSPSPSRDVDPETAQRHATFMARVASLTSNSPVAATSVKSAIRSYRSSESAARDLVTTFYNIVDQDIESTASLIVPLVDLLEEDKKKELLQTFNGFRVEQRQQFPDLGPPGPDPAYAGVASGRVLNVKHSTQSRRPSGQVWDRVARAASSSASSVPGAAGPSARPTERFPALQRTIPGSHPAATPFRQPQRATPWASSSAMAAPPPPLAPRIPGAKINKSSSTANPNLSNSAFPSLPIASTTRTKPSLSGNRSLRNIVGNPAPITNAWNSSAMSTPEVPSVNIDADADESHRDEVVPRKGKKKGKEKVTLFTLGTFPA